MDDLRITNLLVTGTRKFKKARVQPEPYCILVRNVANTASLSSSRFSRSKKGQANAAATIVARTTLAVSLLTKADNFL